MNFADSLAISLVTFFYWLFITAGVGSAIVAIATWIIKRRQPQAEWLAVVTALLGATFLAAAIIVHECVLPYLTGEMSLITQR